MSFTPKQRILMRESQGRAHVYSVRFPDPSSAVGIREDQARGLYAGVANGKGKVRNDFDRIPIFQRPIFNATWNTRTGRWENLVPQGEIGFTWMPTETKREVVYRCRPFWYQLDYLNAYGPTRVSVSDRPLKGFMLAPMFRNETDFVYRPVFELTLDENGMPHSRAGAMPLRTTPEELTDTVRRYGAAARLESVRDWFSDALLQLVEFATWDIGAIMSGNRSDVMVQTGSCIKNAEASLGDYGAGYGCVWRGKENPWKNVNSTLHDLLGEKHVGDDGSVRVTLYYLTDAKKYTGKLNEYYVELGVFSPDVMRGYVPIGAWELSKYGFMWPSQVAKEGIAAKSQAYQVTSNALSGTNFLIRVGVGGGSGNFLLPDAELSSPFHWEASQRGCSQNAYFGGRLVLDEG